MKNWIGRMNELAAGLLFSGGYDWRPTRPDAARTVRAAGVARVNPATPVDAGRIDVTTDSGRSQAVRLPTKHAGSRSFTPERRTQAVKTTVGL